MDLELKKVKTIAKALNLQEDEVKTVLDFYLALSLYNIHANKSDDTIFGELDFDYDNHRLRIIDNSLKTNEVFNGNINTETLKRFLLLGNFNI